MLSQGFDLPVTRLSHIDNGCAVYCVRPHSPLTVRPVTPHIVVPVLMSHPRCPDSVTHMFPVDPWVQLSPRWSRLQSVLDRSPKPLPPETKSVTRRVRISEVTKYSVVSVTSSGTVS